MKQQVIIGMFFIVIVVASFNAKAFEELRYNPFEQPDNLMQTSAGNTAGNAMQLRGTVIDGDDSLVNISGKFYRLNQEVSGYYVVRIESTSVTLRRGSSETVLVLNDNE